MRYGETERIRLPGNWKGARAARDVRLLWFITHRLMRITCVCLTRCVRGSGLRGIVGWKVVIDWAIPADKWEGRGGGGGGSGMCCGLVFSKFTRAHVCLNLIIMGGTGWNLLSAGMYVKTELAALHYTSLKLAERISFGLQGNYRNLM